MESMIYCIPLMGLFCIIALFGIVVPTIDDFREIKMSEKSNPMVRRAGKLLPPEPPPPVPIPPRCWRVPRTDTTPPPKIIIQPGATVSSEDYRKLKPMITEFERSLPIHERS